VIDDGIDALVGKRLIFSAATMQRRYFGSVQLRSKLTHERRLAVAAVGAYVHDDGCTQLVGGPKRGVKFGELARSAHEELGEHEIRIFCDLEAGEDLACIRTCVGIACEQAKAQRAQPIRRIGYFVGWVRRRVVLLVEQQLDGRASMGEEPGHALIQHHTDRIEVGLGARSLGQGLFGSHEARGAQDLVIARNPGITVRYLGDEAKIEDHHSTLIRDEHVRGLEIAVDVAASVERGHGLDELSQREAEPIEVRQRSDRRRLAHPVDEGSTIDQLHREERRARLRDDQLT
jgi:hypothetical protein